MQDPSSPNAAPTSLAPAWHDVLLALAMGIVCYAVSCLLVAPGADPLAFGVQWRDMSKAPLELHGQFPQRLLAPLLAHVLGMGGEYFVAFVRGLAVMLLATVWFFCRRRGASLVDAALVAAAVALTAPIQMYKQHWVGYVDPLGYTLFFWAWLAAPHAALVWLLFLANLVNHELAVFLLPWLWFVRKQAGGGRWPDAVGAALAVGLYGAFYLWVKGAAPQQKYNADYFFANPMFPGGTVVICALALVHVVVAFGPVLAVLAWHQHTRAGSRDRLHLWLVTGGVFAIFCIAWDWSRHSNLIALPLVFASLAFLAAGHRKLYVGLVALGAVLMIWVPPWSPSAWPTSAMANLELLKNTGAGVSNPKTGEPMGGPIGRVLGEWLPAVAPVFVSILAIGAAIWCAGWWLARRDRAATADRGAAAAP